MTILVLLVLVMLWAAVLTPMAVRRFRQGQSDGTGSIESFHEQLHLLGRAGPKLVPPAHRLETSATTQSATPGARRADLVLVGMGTAGAAALGPSPRGARSSERADGERRRRVRRRRRDVLLGLVGTLVLTAALGAVPSLRVLWVLTVLCVVAVAAYVALAAYAQLLDADRQVYRPVSAAQGAAAQGATGWSGAPYHALHAEGGPVADVPRLGSAVVALGTRLPAAARAGYPGAWDEEPEGAAAPRHAAAGS